MRIEDNRVHLLILPWREQPAFQCGYGRRIVREWRG